jgi:hypothetical protein
MLVRGLIILFLMSNGLNRGHYHQVEITERAMAHCGQSEVLIVGGVGCTSWISCLAEMLERLLLGVGVLALKMYGCMQATCVSRR